MTSTRDGPDLHDGLLETLKGALLEMEALANVVDSEPEQAKQRLRELALHLSFASEAAVMEPETRKPQRTKLTAREVEIVKLLAAGATNKRIAADLAITEGTAKIHIYNIFRKVGVSNRVSLTLFAQANGMIER